MYFKSMNLIIDIRLSNITSVQNKFRHTISYLVELFLNQQFIASAAGDAFKTPVTQIVVGISQAQLTRLLLFLDVLCNTAGKQFKTRRSSGYCTFFGRQIQTRTQMTQSIWLTKDDLTSLQYFLMFDPEKTISAILRSREVHLGFFS